MKLVIAALFALLPSAAIAGATPLDLYQQGKFDAAVAAGHAQNNAEGFSVAARAELAAATMRDKPCLSCLKRAEADARKSIAIDPRHADAHVFLAVSLGNQARIIGVVAAGAHQYATKAKDELDAAMTAEPNSAYTWAALGGWNIEIVRNGGASLAHLIYKASVEDGLADFDKAFTLEPDNIVLRYQYALSLSGLDLDTYRTKIEEALNRASNGKAHGVYETFAQGRARELLATLKKNDPDAYSDLVRRDQGYP